MVWKIFGVFLFFFRLLIDKEGNIFNTPGVHGINCKSTMYNYIAAYITEGKQISVYYKTQARSGTEAYFLEDLPFFGEIPLSIFRKFSILLVYL